jgi:hypothetical protein
MLADSAGWREARHMGEKIVEPGSGGTPFQ